MRKMMFALAVFAISVDMMALTRSKVREYARFLSDRMAYELNLSSGQYDDCYEINYDFINAVGDLLDGMESGDHRTFEDYYRYLDYRNEDLSCVLSSYQYSRFLSTESFFRPFCIYEGAWAFRPYMVYTNRNYFYRALPFGYNGYYGTHARRYYSAGFYVGRYAGPHHDFVPIRRQRDYRTFHRRDFGPVYSGHGNPARPSYSPEPGPVEPKAGPGRPQSRPGGSHARPGRSQDRSKDSRMNPGRPQNRPSAPEVKQDRGRKDSRQGGGGVVRRGRG